MELARIGGTAKGGVCRLALTDLDRQGRDLVVSWAKAAGMTVTELTALGEGEIQISAILPRRGEENPAADGGGMGSLTEEAGAGLPNPDHCLAVGEGVMLRGEAAELERLVAAAGLMLVGTLWLAASGRRERVV